MPTATLKSWVTAVNTMAPEQSRTIMMYSLDSASITLKGPDDTTLITGDWGPHTIIDLYTPATWVAVPWGETAVVNAGPYEVDGNYTAPPPADYLNTFTGTGTISLPVQTSIFFSMGGSSNWQTFSITTEAKADISVIYDYTVPEPGSMLALLSGLTALVGVLLRKKR